MIELHQLDMAQAGIGIGFDPRAPLRPLGVEAPGSRDLV